MLEIHTFFHLSVSASRTLNTPKYVASALVWRKVPAFLCLPIDPCCLQDAWFPAIWPKVTLSLLVPGYLPAVTEAVVLGNEEPDSLCEASQKAETIKVCSKKRIYLQGSQARRGENKTQIHSPKGLMVGFLFVCLFLVGWLVWVFLFFGFFFAF